MKKGFVAMMFLLLVTSVFSLVVAEENRVYTTRLDYAQTDEVKATIRGELEELVEEKSREYELRKENVLSHEEYLERLRISSEPLLRELAVDNGGVAMRLRLRERLENDELRAEVEFLNESGYWESIRTRLRLKQDVDNASVLRAELSNGEERSIVVLPDEASVRAREVLQSRNVIVEIREDIHRNTPRVVYHIETNRTGRFLGVFKTSMRMEGELDPETGEVLDTRGPWWAFLVREDEEVQV